MRRSFIGAMSSENGPHFMYFTSDIKVLKCKTTDMNHSTDFLQNSGTDDLLLNK